MALPFVKESPKKINSHPSNDFAIRQGASLGATLSPHVIPRCAFTHNVKESPKKNKPSPIDILKFPSSLRGTK
jgi:hypothetical protein